MIAESILGGLLGGVLRLAPELIKFFDRKDERKHELAMANVELTIAEKKIEFGMRQLDAEVDVATMQAMGQALKGQAEMAKAGGKFISAISAAVRPGVTIWFVGLYSAVKVAVMAMAVGQGAAWQEVILRAWTADDAAILSAIIMFWFVGRPIDKRTA
jgi:hypothetical protein